MPVDDPAFAEAQQTVDDQVKRFLSIGGTRSVDHYHRELGKIMWDYCGMARNKTGLEKALSEIPALRDEFWKDVRVLGDGPMNQSLERAGRVADFFELGELMVRDALAREESCGGHFREESQTEDGEALRDDERFSHVAAWEWAGEGSTPRPATPSRSPSKPSTSPSAPTSKDTAHRCTSSSTSGARPAPTPPARWRPTRRPTSPRR